jgi:hypothetical protein
MREAARAPTISSPATFDVAHIAEARWGRGIVSALVWDDLRSAIVFDDEDLRATGNQTIDGHEDLRQGVLVVGHAAARLGFLG